MSESQTVQLDSLTALTWMNTTAIAMVGKLFSPAHVTSATLKYYFTFFLLFSRLVADRTHVL